MGAVGVVRRASYTSRSVIGSKTGTLNQNEKRCCAKSGVCAVSCWVQSEFLLSLWIFLNFCGHDCGIFFAFHRGRSRSKSENLKSAELNTWRNEAPLRADGNRVCNAKFWFCQTNLSFLDVAVFIPHRIAGWTSIRQELQFFSSCLLQRRVHCDPLP